MYVFECINEVYRYYIPHTFQQRPFNNPQHIIYVYTIYANLWVFYMVREREYTPRTLQIQYLVCAVYIYSLYIYTIYIHINICIYSVKRERENIYLTQVHNIVYVPFIQHMYIFYTEREKEYTPHTFQQQHFVCIIYTTYAYILSSIRREREYIYLTHFNNNILYVSSMHTLSLSINEVYIRYAYIRTSRYAFIPIMHAYVCLDMHIPHITFIYTLHLFIDMFIYLVHTHVFIGMFRDISRHILHIYE